MKVYRDPWRAANACFVLGVCAILLGAFAVQFGAREIPCPLCLLQRLALLGVGTGALMNVVFGVRPRYYGVSLASAIFGGIVAGRQVLLHIAPGTGSYGSPIWGLHLYTWSFIAFVGTCVILSAMLVLDSQFAHPLERPTRLPTSRLHRTAVASFVLIAVANLAVTLLLCGLGPCPADPTGYQWLTWLDQ